jgi:hypothetical protein
VLILAYILKMEIDYLNHASIIIRNNNISLLIDPWLWGTCFEDGWGLRYDNPSAIDKTKDCTHIWISHFHQDHFHRPTLKKILEINPTIQFIGNRSYNFQLDDTAKQIGFKNVVSLFERKPLILGDHFTITRFPTTGIDNMLMIEISGKVILNYNDCNIPSFTQKKLKKKIGHIDYLLTNFNHAGKLFLYPYPPADIIKEKLIKSFSDNYTVFNPDYILPFASYHYYRAPESFKQNEAMLDATDLLQLSPKILNWHPGDKLIDNGIKPEIIKVSQVTKKSPDKLERNGSYSIEELKEAGNNFSETLKSRFGFLSKLSPALYIHVSDQNKTIAIHPYRGVFVAEANTQPHIIAHSEALFNWFSKPYGTDTFVVGAHFDIVSENRVPLKWKIVIGLMVDNKLDARTVIKMMFKKNGLGFLWNRREEMLGLLLNFRLAPSYHED